LTLNLRSPAIAKIFKLPEPGDWLRLLEGTLTFDKALKEIGGGGGKLQVITAGKTALIQ